MRHRKVKGRLNRYTSWRKATLKSLANDLFLYQRIRTTRGKAKALRRFVEPMITLAKNNPDSLSAKRRIFSKLSDKTTVKSLFGEIAPLFKSVPGGYTRIMLMGNRKGDGAEMAIIELTKRTIPEDKLLGIEEPNEKKKKKDNKTRGTAKTDTEDKAVSPIEPSKEKDKDKKKQREEREKPKKEKKKSIFRRFQRKSMD